MADFGEREAGGVGGGRGVFEEEQQRHIPEVESRAKLQPDKIFLRRPHSFEPNLPYVWLY